MLNLKEIKKANHKDGYREETGIEKEYLLAGALYVFGTVSGLLTATVALQSEPQIATAFFTA